MSGVDLLLQAFVPLAAAMLVAVVFGGALLIGVLLIVFKMRQIRRLSTMDHRFEHAGNDYRLVVEGSSGLRLVVGGTPARVRSLGRRSTGGVHSLRTFAFEQGAQSGEVAVRYESWRPRSAEVRVDGTPIFRTLEDFG